ncbi:Methyltransferase domain-containing protein [Algoriphagus locisalis]|uniref:Methyltransferase domain-containing protein n=1 Tax=Algoriphagus locisalis TaxID=305507 RepID=A0A1I6XVP4_9BACT|nr:class I SAM-dependent methyltransferase [Algoriphagus locisalis]SFT41874.1 Methyltransferase domain-containing protein [Algoriphagus locisalis]
MLGAIKKKFYDFYTQKHRLIQKPNFENMPTPEIGYKHVENGGLLANREQLLGLLPHNGIVAELGVAHGDFSRKILEINKPSKLHLVDVWQSERYPEKLFHEVSQKFQKEKEEGKVVINRGLSTEVVDQFPDAYFDWIYIDTAHTYLVTKAELESYLPKMKVGGVIAGHDFIVGEIDVPWKYGVIEAVYEFCEKYNWEIIYLTMERGISPSFAIREISKG